MKFAIYHENCTSKGRIVADREIEEHGWDCADWFVIDGSPTELLDLADSKEKHARPAGGGTYDRRVADTIREFVFFEHPELMPEEEDE